MDKKVLPEQMESFWHKTGHVAAYPQLVKDLTVDVAVIGGGIAGILAAYQLASLGKRVALLEARKLIYGTTGFTTAKLSAQHDLIYAELIQRYGAKKARSYYDANMTGTKIIRDIAEKYGIECELKEEDAYVYTQCESRVNDIEKEVKAYQELAIAEGLVNELPVDLGIKAAVVMHNQYKFHPVLFLAGVLKELEKMNVTIVENTLVTEVNEGDTVLLKTENGEMISCKQAICASHYPVDDPNKFYAKNMRASLSLATVYDFDNSYPGGVYLNSDIPSRTFRSIDVNEKPYLLVGGESHGLGTGTSEIERYESIINFAEKTFGVKEVIAHWSSHDYLTKDRLPFAGLSRPDRKNIFVVTGLNKWGLSNSAIIGKLLADRIEGKENAYQELFNPYREIPDIKESEQEKPKQLSKQKRNTSAFTGNIKDLGKEEALTYEKEDKKVGVFKDDDGKLHRLNLKCTHLGCKVSWNDGDETWDCPCHGSRFNAMGEVIEGPAMKPLSKVEKDDSSLS